MESETLEYHMAHINAATGKLLVQFLKYRNFEVMQLAAGFDMRGNEAMSAAAEEEDCNLIALWAVGDELDIPQLQNAALSKLHKIQRNSGLIKRPRSRKTVRTHRRGKYVAKVHRRVRSTADDTKHRQR